MNGTVESVLVTGASSGIGEATARRLAAGVSDPVAREAMRTYRAVAIPAS
ncbi:hypothetical protein ACFWTE_23545 [Nocardiopsis sp. NPDC058631]